MHFRNFNYVAVSLIMLIAVFIPLSSAAQNGYGTSMVHISQNSINITPNSIVYLTYNVTLKTGLTWGTTINIINQSELSSNGIYITLSRVSSDPTFSGVMAINASSAAKPGNYIVGLNATGDDPSQNEAVFKLTIYGQSNQTKSPKINATNQSTTIQQNSQQASSQSTSSLTSQTSNTIGTPAGNKANGSNGEIYYIIVIVVVIALLLALRMKLAKPKKAKS